MNNIDTLATLAAIGLVVFNGLLLICIVMACNGVRNENDES